ncbi:Peptide chain release factor 3 [Mycobacteroides abscessus subsp. abscessus]|nr:Peptide chain release factor 3 [Mycobacteroides abscessus subsp. abscessus]
MMLVDEAGEAFDNEALLNGELTPVFFGSALANFGVQNFLNAYVDHVKPIWIQSIVTELHLCAW